MTIERNIIQDEQSAELEPNNRSKETGSIRLSNILNTALQHHRTGSLEKAEAIYRQILQDFPNQADAWHLMGLIAFQRGDLDLSLELINKAITINASIPVFHNNLGNVLKQQNKLDDAIKSYYDAINLDPHYAEVYFNLATILSALGDLDAAVNCYKNALNAQPNYPEAYNNLGNLLRRIGNIDGATKCYKQAISIDPNYAEAYMNLGLALQTCGDFKQATYQYQMALLLNPDFPEAHNNIGNVLYDQGKIDSAIKHYKQAILLRPDFPEAHNNLITPLREKGDFDGCIKHYKAAIHLQPNLAEAHNNLAAVMISKYRLNDAIKLYRQAIKIKPDFAEAHSNLLYNLHYHHDIGASKLFNEHKKWAIQHAEPLSFMILPHTNNREPDRRLRIGYCSPDLCSHPVPFFIETLLAFHNRSSFEIYCYSDVAKPDVVTGRIKGLSDHWRNIHGMNHDQVSALVRDDSIDILVDLAGHTSNNRMLMFARKPAPVQVSYLGYPNTTGLPTINYRITDSYADPERQSDPFFSEKLVRLPKSFLCYQPPKESPEVAGLPALNTGQITFGSFNNLSKVTPKVIEIWSSILKAVPRSIIFLKASQFRDDEIKRRIYGMFAQKGISQGRIKMLDRVPSFTDHLNLYNEIDIGLDTFPYNGTTTTCEALWMGVPVIVLEGGHHVARVGVSILTNIGLSELISGNKKEYIKKAITLAYNLEHLSSLRSCLRSMVGQSPLSNTAHFMKYLELAYHEMWMKWCENGAF